MKPLRVPERGPGFARHPQQVPFRKALFRVHLWCGIALGLYVFFISLTGSVLVYRNELYAAAEPDPIYSTASGPLLSDQALTAQALLAYPAYRVARFHRPRTGVRVKGQSKHPRKEALIRFLTLL